MNEHKYSMIVELSEDTFRRFHEKIYADGTTPAEVLEGFINDLVASDQSRGSDERMYAQQYYDRCGYGYSFDNFRTFTQWMLLYYPDELQCIADAVDDVKTFKEEITYLQEHPEEDEPGRIEELQAEIADSEAYINDFYQDYKQGRKDPEALEAGIQHLLEYLEAYNNMKGGI